MGCVWSIQMLLGCVWLIWVVLGCAWPIWVFLVTIRRRSGESSAGIVTENIATLTTLVLEFGLLLTWDKSACLTIKRVMLVILFKSEAHQTGPCVSLCWTLGGYPSPSVVGGLPETTDHGMRTLVC